MIVSFAISGNKYCRGNTFSCFLGIPLHGLDLITFFFGNIFSFFGLIFLWVLCIPNPCMNRAWLAFQQYLSGSVAMATLFFCF